MVFQLILAPLLVVVASACDCSLPVGGCNSGVEYGNLGPSDRLLGYGNLGCGNVGVAEGVVGLNNLGISGGDYPIDIASSGLYSSGLSSIAGPSVNAPEVVLPSPPSQPIPAVAPRVLSNVCKGVRTIVSSRPMKQVINVPVKRQFTQTFTRPKVETIIYRAKPVSSGLSSLPSLGVGACGYPQGDLIGSQALDASLLPTVGASCLSSLPSYPQFGTIGVPSLEASLLPTIGAPFLSTLEALRASPASCSCLSSVATYPNFPTC